MRCRTMICVLCLLSAAAALVGQQPPVERPKLDCQKLTLDLATAMETRDYESIARIMGQKLDKEDVPKLQKDIDEYEKAGKLTGIINALRLFPQVGEPPAWVNSIEIGMRYLDNNRFAELGMEFRLKDNVWCVGDFDVEPGKEVPREELDKCKTEMSQAPAEGQKTIDAGLTKAFTATLDAMKAKDWTTLRKLFLGAGKSTDAELEQQLQKVQERAGGKYFELAAQFPGIGLVPAPIIEFEFQMSGIVDGKETKLEVQFQWRAGETVLTDIDAKQRAPKEPPANK
ncbi:MAG: hypothetical protein RDV41_07115 [Planctomycetota bacterium]|nr:hypothetical protein [Planctomycetota bacterium]